MRNEEKIRLIDENNGDSSDLRARLDDFLLHGFLVVINRNTESSGGEPVQTVQTMCKPKTDPKGDFPWIIQEGNRRNKRIEESQDRWGFYKTRPNYRDVGVWFRFAQDYIWFARDNI